MADEKTWTVEKTWTEGDQVQQRFLTGLTRMQVIGMMMFEDPTVSFEEARQHFADVENEHAPKNGRWQ